MNELQAGVELAFAVFPQTPIFLQPSKVALDNPAFWHHLEGVQFAALSDLHGDVFAQQVFDVLSEGLAT